MTVRAVHRWPSNAHLIADVVKLHHPGGYVLDATYGRGGWWKQWRPLQLVTNDLNRETAAQFHYDFRDLPWDDEEFYAVAFDPPYKLNGTPALGDFDDRYGIGQPTSWQDRMEAIAVGARECARVASTLLYVKCQDQVVGGRIRWQTLMVANELAMYGWLLVDRFDMLGGGRPQPPGRRQIHAHGRPSTLLVFEKEPT